MNVSIISISAVIIKKKNGKPVCNSKYFFFDLNSDSH